MFGEQTVCPIKNGRYMLYTVGLSMSVLLREESLWTVFCATYRCGINYTHFKRCFFFGVFLHATWLGVAVPTLF